MKTQYLVKKYRDSSMTDAPLKPLSLASIQTTLAIAISVLTMIISGSVSAQPTIWGGSTLLSSADATQLQTWLGQGPIELTKIFTRTTGDGKTASDFHNAADGKGPTFTVYEVLATQGNTRQIIGGYNPQSWGSFGNWNYTPDIAHRTAFLFNLSTPTPTKQAQRLSDPEGVNQTYNSSAFGPIFGAGIDINITGSLSSGSVYPYTYNSGINILGTTGGRNVDYGTIEVFTIAQVPPETPSLVVTTTSDSSTDYDNLTSLREAIGYANRKANANASTPDEITFSSLFNSAQTVTLLSELDDLSESVTITGPGANKLTVKGDSTFEIFHVKGRDAADNVINFSVSGLTLSHGKPGIFTESLGSLDITGCTITTSTTGIINDRAGVVNLINSTVSGNTIAGIKNVGKVTLTNSTVSGNGNGIDNLGVGIVEAFHCTITKNTTGIFNEGGVTLKNTILAGNTTNGGGSVAIANNAGDYNLIGGDPKLDDLAQAIGEPTATHALKPSSPAINTGDPAFTDASNPLTDQRGQARFQKNRLDIGAYESSLEPDTTAPTVSISSTASNPTKTSPIPVTVTFSESVFGFTSSDLTLGNGSASNFTGSGTTYTFDLTPAAQGSVTVDIAANVAQDAAENNNTAATQFSRTFDSVAPTVSITSAAPSLTNSSPIAVTVTFNEAVTGFEEVDLSVVGGTVSDFAGSGKDYTFNLTPAVPGAVTVNIAAGVAQDAAGNGNTVATQFSRTYDSVAPTVSITAVNPDPRDTAVSSIEIKFSEAVTGFNLADLSLTRGASGNLLTGAQTLTSNDSITWTLNGLDGLTATDGTYTLTLTATGSGIADLAGNALSTGATESWRFGAINRAPVNSVPGAQTVAEDTNIVFSQANNNLISISDPDVNVTVNEVKVTLVTVKGKMTLSRTTGLTFLSGGNGLASMSFTGTIENINKALDGAKFTPTPNYSGASSVSIITDDQGHSNGDALTDSDAINITVTEVNDAPVAVNDAAIATVGIPVTFSVVANDSDLEGHARSVTALSAITPNLGSVVNNNNGTVTFTPTAAGTASFTYTITDNGTTNNIADPKSATATVTMTITAPPTQCPQPVANGAVSVTRLAIVQDRRNSSRFTQQVILTNISGAPIAGPLFYVLNQDTLGSTEAKPVTLNNRSGLTACAVPVGSPYVTIPGGLGAGSTVMLNLDFTNKPLATYVHQIREGPGTP